MNTKYSRQQIEKSIKYWKNRLINEDFEVDNRKKDSLINIIYQLEDVVAWLCN